MLRKRKGFTLIELLLVVSLIAALTGITIRIINSDDKRRISEDSVKQSNLQKLSLGIEAYKAGEPLQDYPQQAVVKTTVAGYVENWPDGEPLGAFYLYRDFPPGRFIVYVVRSKPTDGSRIYKYSSEWGQVKDCSSTEVTDASGC
ncbi:MAG TPA: type II secretion system protein [Patescibacteria group bacterium]|nr:type II secretion system protein [Patescibacteria group bacterium]